MRRPERTRRSSANSLASVVVMIWAVAGGVTTGAGVGVDHHRPGAVGKADIGGAAATLGEVDPDGVVSDSFENRFGDAVAAQLCGQEVVEPGVVDRFDVGCRHQTPVGDYTDTTHGEPLSEIGQHVGQGGGVVGVPRKHPMRDRETV